MNDACRHEIIELHRFFEDWFRAAIGPTVAVFTRLARVLDPDFELISPGGVVTPRLRLLEVLRQAHGSRRSQQPPFRIWIDHFRGRSVADGLQLATYEEWQETEDGSRGRLSTALFRLEPETPHGVCWLHLHEVWLPDDSVSG
jgi:hypothetical protein